MVPDLVPKQLTSIGLFQSTNFSSIFRQAQYKCVNNETWENLVFDRYFPRKGEAYREGLQGFPVARYYRGWSHLLGRVNIQRAEKIRGFVLNWFCKLWWLPFPESDRMWSTKETQLTRKSGWIMVPSGQPQKCPRLAINQAALRSEEEEDVRSSA
jgi:hypothetical protein